MPEQVQVADKALDTISQAIQGGMVGVAIIMAVAIILAILVIALAIRSNGRSLLEMLKFNGRLAAAVERIDTTLDKMDTTLDKVSEQTSAGNTVLAELTIAIRETKDGVGLMQKDFQTYATLSDDTIAGFRETMETSFQKLYSRIDTMNDRLLAKAKPDTQPIPAIDPPTEPPTLPT